MRIAVALFQTAVDDAHQNDHAEVAVIPLNPPASPLGGVAVAFGGGQRVHDGLERFGDADAGFGGHAMALGGIDADDVFDLFGNAITVGGGQVDLVEDGTISWSASMA